MLFFPAQLLLFFFNMQTKKKKLKNHIRGKIICLETCSSHILREAVADFSIELSEVTQML